MRGMQEQTKDHGRRLLEPLVVLLTRFRVSPTAVTLAALPFSVVAACFFASGRFLLAGVAQAVAGVCDSLDGQVSRRSACSSARGAFLDSTVDRINEGLVLAGIAWHYMVASRLLSLLAIVAMLLSLLVSYVRARAEGIGCECRVGFFERPVRVVLLVAGALLPWRWSLPAAIALIATGSMVTLAQRVGHVLRQPDRRV